MTETAGIRGPARATRNAAPADRTVAGVSDLSEEMPAAEAVEASPPAREAPPAPPQSRQPAASGGSGFVPLLLGGVAAALIGFALANYAVPQGWPRPPEPDPELQSRLSGLEAGLDEVTGRIDGLAARVDDLANAPAASDAATAEAVSALEAEIGEVRGELASLGEAIGGLSSGAGPAAEMPDFTGAFNDQMADFQAEIDRVTSAAEDEVAAARAEAEATRAAAEKAERQAALRAALAEVEVALDTGSPFADALGELDGLDVPAALSEVANDGVAPLSELQRTFPDAARAALQAATRGPAEDAGALDRMTAFLLAQTNARSLEPREGDDADAVLSRAEAALRSGDLEAALGELDTLEEPSRAALGDWLSRAEARETAAEAVDTLAQSIDAM